MAANVGASRESAGGCDVHALHGLRRRGRGCRHLPRRTIRGLSIGPRRTDGHLGQSGGQQPLPEHHPRRAVDGAGTERWSHSRWRRHLAVGHRRRRSAAAGAAPWRRPAAVSARTRHEPGVVARRFPARIPSLRPGRSDAGGRSRRLECPGDLQDRRAGDSQSLSDLVRRWTVDLLHHRRVGRARDGHLGASIRVAARPSA